MEDLGKKRSKVLGQLAGKGPASIRNVARACFPGVRPVTKADSWVRNALRILVRDGYASRKARGTYDATAKGRASVATPVVESAGVEATS